MWITKVTAARVPKDWDGKSSPHLLTLDHTKGWLTDTNLNATPLEGAAWNDYSGNRDTTSWHIDEEIAKASIAYHAGITGLEDQFLTWNEALFVDADVRNFFTNPKWTGTATWEPRVSFAHKVPAQVNGQGPKWLGGGIDAAQNNDAPISVRVLSGPARAKENNQLTLHFDAIYPNFSSKIVFLASAPQGNGFRATELVGMMNRGFKGLNKGAQQIISFEPLPDRITSKSLPI